MSTLDDLLKVEDIAHFRELGSCADGLAWCEEAPRTWRECINKYAYWTLVHACERLTDEQFAATVEREPLAALAHPHVCDRLTGEQFSATVARAPWCALEYPHVRDRLTGEQFAAEAAIRPWLALRYPHVAARIEAEK